MSERFRRQDHGFTGIEERYRLGPPQGGGNRR